MIKRSSVGVNIPDSGIAESVALFVVGNGVGVGACVGLGVGVGLGIVVGVEVGCSTAWTMKERVKVLKIPFASFH